MNSQSTHFSEFDVSEIFHLTSGDELDIVLEPDADYNLMMSSDQPPPNSYVVLKFAGKWSRGKVLSSQPNVSSKFKD